MGRFKMASFNWKANKMLKQNHQERNNTISHAQVIFDFLLILIYSHVV